MEKRCDVLRLHRFFYSSSFLILNTNFNIPRNIFGLFTTTTFITQNLRNCYFRQPRIMTATANSTISIEDEHIDAAKSPVQKATVQQFMPPRLLFL